MGRNWAATLLAFKHITFLSSHGKVKLRVNTTYRPYTLQGIPSYVAYDKTFCFVYLFSLHQKLKGYGVGERSCALLKDYLTGKQQRLTFGDTFFKWKCVKRGVPPGSVMGLMFFNLLINNLFYHVKRAKLNAYADHHDQRF